MWKPYPHITGEAEALSDPHIASVELLLHGNGADGGIVFTDSSSNNFTVSRFGGTVTSATQSRFGGTSLAFAGSNDALSVADNANLELGSGDFTIECWFYSTKSANSNEFFGLVCKRHDNGLNHSWSLFIGSTPIDVLGFGFTSGGTTATEQSIFCNQRIQLNRWYHVAVVREGTQFRMYLDGLVVGTRTVTSGFTLHNNATAIGIARLDMDNPVTSQFFDGFMEEIRITVGVARYKGNFTRPSIPFPDS